MTRARKLALTALVPVALACGGFVVARDHVRAAGFVTQAADLGGAADAAAAFQMDTVEERPLTVPWRGGELKGRVYMPSEPRHRALLLVPGVHASGIAEPRLVKFARDLAAFGLTVLTVEARDLARYRITPASTDMIEDAAGWLAGQPALAPSGRIGMAGISFAGGLSLVAASRPSIRDRVEFVLSFGGHGDLPRTLRYLCTGIQPDGVAYPPHDYGVAIILLGVADRVVPAEQAQPLREGILLFLEGSRLAAEDPEGSAAAFDRARAHAAALPQPARGLLEAVNARDVATLGPLLLPHTSELGGDPALSPAGATPAAHVFLLHGTGDNVIPAIESRLLAETFRERGVRVRQLATPLVTHAEVDNAAALADVWRLIDFWAEILG